MTAQAQPSGGRAADVATLRKTIAALAQQSRGQLGVGVELLDLDYFIGYRIAESSYARATDKRAALRAIIEVGDADQFLIQSGYAP